MLNLGEVMLSAIFVEDAGVGTSDIPRNIHKPGLGFRNVYTVHLNLKTFCCIYKGASVSNEQAHVTIDQYFISLRRPSTTSQTQKSSSSSKSTLLWQLKDCPGRVAMDSPNSPNSSTEERLFSNCKGARIPPYSQVTEGSYADWVVFLQDGWLSLLFGR